MTTSGKFNLLIIDPQSDFVDAPYKDENNAELQVGRLPVVGASKDMERIISLIQANKDNINKIFVSMDTHTVSHIGHKFWIQSADNTKLAPPGTTFKVENDRIMGSSDGRKTFVEYVVNVKEEDRDVMNKYAKKYIDTVVKDGAKDGRNIPCTWSIHCLQGTPGWNIHPLLKKELDAVKDKVEYHIKGQNQLTEMYSIMKAEAPYEEIIKEGFNENEKVIISKYVYNPEININYEGVLPEGTSITDTNNITYTPSNIYDNFDETKYNLKTTYNEELFNKLTEKELSIFVCGEALSHCVQFSTRDIVEKIKEKKLPNKVSIIKNASSYVNLDAINLNNMTKVFRTSAEDFLVYMDSLNGVYIVDNNGNLIKDIFKPYMKSTSSATGIIKMFGGKTKRNRNAKKTKRRKNATKRNKQKIYEL